MFYLSPRKRAMIDLRLYDLEFVLVMLVRRLDLVVVLTLPSFLGALFDFFRGT